MEMGGSQSHKDKLAYEKHIRNTLKKYNMKNSDSFNDLLIMII